MTLTDWLNSNFPMIDSNLMILQDNNVVVFCTPTTLESILSGVTVPPTYSELIALSITSQGWQTIFDQWKANGIVS